MIFHEHPHPLADKKVKLRNFFAPGVIENPDFVIEDWFDRIGGGSWMSRNGNPACLLYAMRSGLLKSIPTDDEVVYGKIGHLGFLVHNSEIKEGEVQEQ